MNPRLNLSPVGPRSACASNGSAQGHLPALTDRPVPADPSEAIEHLLHRDSPLPLLTFIFLAVIIAVSLQWRWRLHSRGPRKRLRDVVETTSSIPALSDPFQTEAATPQENDGRIRRKETFLERSGGDYGYAGAPCGFIDQWRATELPGLIPPCDRSPEESGTEKEVYVDYAGSALPTSSQLREIQHILGAATVLANPHSNGPAASRTRRLVEQAKTRVLDLLHAHPGRYAAFGNVQPTGTSVDGRCNDDDDEAFDRHPGYEIVFTSGTTEALRILSERFPIRKGSLFVYAQNSHTSVIGMRGPVRSRGGAFVCRTVAQLEDDVERCDPADVWFDDKESTPLKTSPSNHLVAIPLECNFGGNRTKNARSVLSKLRQQSNDVDRYYSLLDIAKAASTSEINLNALNPDFAVLSFYKLFGEPTGLGCLLVKRSSMSVLCSGVDDDSRCYFGGGAVDAVLSSTDFIAPRTEPTPLARLSSGTSHFRGIVALHAGLDELARVGGMGFIQRHTSSLAVEFVRRLRMLVHEDTGRPVVQLYSGWKQWNYETTERPHSDHGPTVAFNILRGDGTYVGYSEVSKLAALNRPPIQFRTGCFCNPGACQLELGFSEEELLYNFQQAGHVCGDEVSLVKGRPTGAIRVSFGKDSTWEDLDAVVCFVQQVFARPKAEFVAEPVRWDAKPRNVVLSELYLFPIKSCAAQRVKRWTISRDGKLSYDREFALVDSSGSAMRLQMYPKMAFIVASIDDHGETMTVSAPGQEEIVIRLDDRSRDISDHMNKGSVKVCGNQCHGSLWGDHHVSQWFSNYLEVRCFLARFNSESYDLPCDVSVPGSPQRSRGVAFANEQPLLLLSEKAVETLNQLLESRNQRLVTPRHFRPNMVVRIEGERAPTTSNLEDGWTNLEFKGKEFKLEVVGPCPRCSMVDIDPTSGMKGKTLRALAEYRRCNGQINFGIFLRASRRASAPCSDGLRWIEEGDVIYCS
jgi:molybdenum cofactor sulfurtransferase